MYGMLYRLRAKGGKERAALDQIFRWEQEILPSAVGFVAGYLFQSSSQPTEMMAMVLFTSEADYVCVRADPVHTDWYQHLLTLVETLLEESEGEFIELVRDPPGL